MTRCNRGVVLGNVCRWCHLDVGHRGEHVCIWREKPFPFPEPPPRYGADGLPTGESK